MTKTYETETMVELLAECRNGKAAEKIDDLWREARDGFQVIRKNELGLPYRQVEVAGIEPAEWRRFFIAKGKVVAEEVRRLYNDGWCLDGFFDELSRLRSYRHDFDDGLLDVEDIAFLELGITQEEEAGWEEAEEWESIFPPANS